MPVSSCFSCSSHGMRVLAAGLSDADGVGSPALPANGARNVSSKYAAPLVRAREFRAFQFVRLRAERVRRIASGLWIGCEEGRYAAWVRLISELRIEIAADA